MEMNQTCKVCGEPAAGFHFGAFTCEGCKSFFGRSYNNLSSITDCKNNGECTINKKNRTACKACRLKKCIRVGMSKSGSRYGRRSNWFKIHCLLQEQQQQQAAAVAAQGGSKNTPPPPPMNMLGHPSYPHGMLSRSQCTKEELMLLGFEDYKPPSASPSVSSPDSHNSDSSVEVGDRRNSMIRHGMPQRDTILPPPINKELFLPLPFSGLSMPPHRFLSHSHLMFPNYHSALYAQHQGLLQPVIDAQTMMNGSHQQHMAAAAAAAAAAASATNNNSRFIPNHNNIKNEEDTKRYFLDAVLKSQRSPMNMHASSDAPAEMSHHEKIDEDEEIDTEEDLVVSMTPPRSPPSTASANSTTCHSVARLTQSTPISMVSSAVTIAHLHQDIPIDLSMKTGSSCSSDDARTMSPGARSDISSMLDETDKKSRRSSPALSEHADDDTEFRLHESKRIRLAMPIAPPTTLTTTTPLDLTTKV